MITVKLNTDSIRDKMIVSELDKTPNSIFSTLGINPSGSMVSIDGRTLESHELDLTFEELHVKAGATTSLNSNVKADGGTN
ncbi:MAG: hypothetical protein FWC11_03180 [Firmicutes bacterium]|nr:hypothetical protein [Bacillota bacterium]